MFIAFPFAMFPTFQLRDEFNLICIFIGIFPSSTSGSCHFNGTEFSAFYILCDIIYTQNLTDVLWHYLCAILKLFCILRSRFFPCHIVSLLTGSNAQCHIAQTHRNEIQQHIQMLIRLNAIKFIQIHCYGFRTTVTWSCSAISFMVSNSKCTTDHQEMIELWYFWCI